jgi:hypothetical protein
MADHSLATLPSLSEEELALWLRIRGGRIAHHKGRYWLVKPFGFFHAIHPLARMSAAEATRPDLFCWGFRTTLREADAHLANSTMPVHFLADVAGYDLQKLRPRHRNQIRNCFKEVEIVAIDRPGLLLEQGFDVAHSARARNGYGKVPEPKRYKKDIERFFAAPCGLLLGGLIDGRLGGYLAGYAVGSTAYIESVTLATEYLGTNISSGLFFAWMQVCKSSGRIKQVVHGLHTPENAGLCRHKDSLGLSVVHLPAIAWFMPPSDRMVKRLRPYAYYRLKGHMAESV